jgi:hypothetical protein
MPIVSQTPSAVKQTCLKPFQFMLIVLASQRACMLVEAQSNLLLQKMNGLIDTALRSMAQSPTPEGIFAFERDLAELLRQLGLRMHNGAGVNVRRFSQVDTVCLDLRTFPWPSARPYPVSQNQSYPICFSRLVDHVLG